MEGTRVEYRIESRSEIEQESTERIEGTRVEQ